MGRGGRRSTTFNSTWKHGKTRTIRVAIVLAERVLNYAHLIDNNEDYERQIILTALNRYIESQQSSPGGNQHRRKGEPLNIKKLRDWTHFVKFMKEIEKENEQS